MFCKHALFGCCVNCRGRTGNKPTQVCKSALTRGTPSNNFEYISHPRAQRGVFMRGEQR